MDAKHHAAGGGTISNRASEATAPREIQPASTSPSGKTLAKSLENEAILGIAGGGASPGLDAAIRLSTEVGSGLPEDHVVGFVATPSSRIATGSGTRVWTPPTAALRNIGEATFGPPPPVAETVVGPDDRRAVADTTAFPWSAIASLVILAKDGSTWLGTGWFIGPRTVITAGHVVYLRSPVPGRTGFPRSITVIPGRDGARCPFGIPAKSNVFHTHENWVNDGDADFDYGAIILPSDVDGAVGAFGFGKYTDADLRASSVVVAGYPADKPAGTQWWDGKPIENVDNHRVYYEADTSGGQSGAPAFRMIAGQPYAVAVHAYGSPNFGVRINDQMYQNLQRWQNL